MEPSSEEEIFPSPLASNFLKTYSSSSVNGARECNDNGCAWDAMAMDEGVDADDDDDVVLRSFFFLLKRDLKPMIFFGR
ncbi:hypothetical protein CR513_40724, partial [Mucuna pruriens]